MQKRRDGRQGNAMTCGHRVHSKFAGRILESPWVVVDIRPAACPVLGNRVEAVTLREPIVKGPGARIEWIARGPIVRAKLCLGIADLLSLAVIIDAGWPLKEGHPRMKIRQSEDMTG